MDIKRHWDKIYRVKPPSNLGWYQALPEISLRLIEETGISRNQPIIDIGGGASNLVDYLLDRGHSDVSVLDVSDEAIKATKKRLGQQANTVKWYENNILQFQIDKTFDIWHDRALFHFLTDAKEKKTYVSKLDNHLSETGHVIIATFSLSGPKRCSGLDVVRYDEERIQKEFNGILNLYNVTLETHITPTQMEQKFKYFCFKRK